MPLFAAAVTVAVFAAQSARAESLEKTKKVGAATVHYKVVLPNGYDPAKAYPGILALGGGPQTMETVDRVLDHNLRAEAEKRGYIVVAPAAPDGELFFEGGERIFPEFLKAILSDYRIQENKFNIAGPSNGGIAAFHVAALKHHIRWGGSPLAAFTPERAQSHPTSLMRSTLVQGFGTG
jgi:dipeptidyl aminopeptidase/acylaminoacyl peptidase